MKQSQSNLNLITKTLGLVLVLLGVVAPQEGLAEGPTSAKILLDRQAVAANLQLVASSPETSATYGQEGILLKSIGDSVFIYTFAPGEQTFDLLRLTLKTDLPVNLDVIPDITTTAKYTFELQQKVVPSAAYTTVEFSLINVGVRQASNLGIKFSSPRLANIVLQKVELSRQGFWQKLLQGWRDYFRVAPYSGFTVNLFPTPRIFHHSAMAYFFPVILPLLGLALFTKKYRRPALWGLLLFWLVTDLRMGYEFLNYQIVDYHTWIKPPGHERTLRIYGNFYSYIEWLKKNLPASTPGVNFYYFGSPHLPGILQYYLYPQLVYATGQNFSLYAIYERADIRFDAQASRLYQADQAFTPVGRVLAKYNDHSFIFITP